VLAKLPFFTISAIPVKFQINAKKQNAHATLIANIQSSASRAPVLKGKLIGSYFVPWQFSLIGLY
jgi:hypothetical protein